MSDLYAKIDMTYSPGAVINTQLVNPSTDFLDPAFTWIDIANILPQPYVWCSYDGTNFSSAMAAPYLGSIPSSIPTGTLTTFSTFTLSSASQGFPVSISNNILTIGCVNFDYIWTRYALYMLLTQGITVIGALTMNNDGSINYNNQFDISASDINLIYTTLCSLQ